LLFYFNDKKVIWQAKLIKTLDVKDFQLKGYISGLIGKINTSEGKSFALMSH